MATLLSSTWTSLLFLVLIAKAHAAEDECGNFQVSSSNDIVTISGSGVFDSSKCGHEIPSKDSMHSMVFEYGVTEFSYLFLDAGALESVTFPDSLLVIGYSAFRFCMGLRSIAFGANLREIRDEAFVLCMNLEVGNLPDSLEIIGDRALVDCADRQLSLGPNVRELRGNWWPERLEFLEVDESNPWFTSLANGALFTRDLTTVLFWPPDGYETLQELPSETRIAGHSAFRSMRARSLPSDFFAGNNRSWAARF
jgi:hypothetical protein